LLDVYSVVKESACITLSIDPNITREGNKDLGLLQTD